ncbi:MAG: hypothetical protein IT531_02590 [Burkholderiales bacterium]|nr:hypothetical protein [Burkholderiales bacterium]
MANITTHHIAELLVGIARAQQAIIEAVESAKPGFRSTHLSPALMNAARVRDTHRPLQLADLPARVLLQCMGRNGADLDHVARDLDELIERQARSAAEPDSLDMTK